ncbi:MAG: prolyl oligopeptidase family serine peptidase [Steroidobacteraceae bacterium]
MDSTLTNPATDPYQWLEDVQGERSLGWVREHNDAARALLTARPDFESMRDRIRAVLDSKEQIPVVTRSGDWLYNHWQDSTNPRGLLRRTTLAEYRKPSPAWEVLLDLDALAREEGENWVLAGLEWLRPGHRRVLLRLSRGGADAVVVREWDAVDRRFVEGGFTLPEAKTNVGWLDADTLLVGTDFGPGSMTASGYPRIVKRWKRGQPLAEAEVLLEGESGDIAVNAGRDDTPGYERTLAVRFTDFFNSRLWLVEDGQLREVDRPSDSNLTLWHDWAVMQLKSDWTVAGRTWPAGSALICRADAYLRGEREFQALFTPTPTCTLAAMAGTASRILMVVQDNVSHRLECWSHDGTAWVSRDVPAPSHGVLSVSQLHDPHVADDPLAEAYFQKSTGFLTPDTLSLRNTLDDASEEPLKSRPDFFNADGLVVEQRFATSRDGTRVPYFIVHRKGLVLDGTNPTLLYGYGGYEISMLPQYSGALGIGWLERGGVYVLSNIRGGGEFGPTWHRAAQRGNRQKSFDDFIAVAEHLTETGVTSPRHLGIQGGSNGGLLVAAVMVQRPELFNAVVCQVPLTDMQRFHRMLAGASWVAEFGNPDDPADWAFLEKYSPYHNVRAERRYPTVLFTTSTRDDRVHPGHARKMAARMIDQGHDVLYYENIEGGHGGAADNAQRADLTALTYAFLWRQLG